MSFTLTYAAAVAAVIAGLSAGSAFAHEGNDHAEQQAPVPADVAPRGEASFSSLELVAVAQGTDLVIYLDRFATNEPVKGASIEVETPNGPANAVEAGDVYRLNAPWLAKSGRVGLIFTVTTGDSVDVLPLSFGNARERNTIASQANAPSGGNSFARKFVEPAVLGAAAFGFFAGIAVMVVLRRRRWVSAVLVLFCILSSGIGRAIAHEGEDHETAVHASPKGSERAQRLSDGTIFVPKPIQRIFGLRTAVIESATFFRSTELHGRIIPDPNASGYVQAAVGGRISPPPNGFPRLGTMVRQGDVLAFITPVLQAIDVSDMRQRQGELDQQISIVERRLARYEQLTPSGAVSRTQLEDTKLELDGLKIRRASLDNVRRESEALVAPVSGIVAEGTPVAGQIAQPNVVIFHIVDPAKLWVEALSFDAVAEPKTASALTANGRVLPLVFRGAGFADRSQSIPVHFSIEGDASGLRAGQFLTVLVSTDEQRQGLAIPRAGLIRTANGQDIVYEHVAAERFEPRPVRIEPLDGERVLVAAGIEPGKRIVIQGAELLDHVR